MLNSMNRPIDNFTFLFVFVLLYTFTERLFPYSFFSQKATNMQKNCRQLQQSSIV